MRTCENARMEIVSPIVTGVVLLTLARLIPVPKTVRLHDARVRDRNEDLLTWMQDDDQLMEREIAVKLEDAAEKGVHLGGAPIQMRDKVTAIFEHRYRDQLRTAERIAHEVELDESWAHRAYRRLWRKPYVAVTAPHEGAAILDRWQARQPPPEKLRAA
jgi:hypothetical protein